jgi:hypothetical protein
MYFLRLMADGRKLEQGLGPSRVSSGADVQEREIPLITADYALWASPPFVGNEAPASVADSPLELTKPRRHDTTQLFG